MSDPDRAKLTERDHWDRVWSQNPDGHSDRAGSETQSAFRRLIKRIVGKKLLKYGRSYVDYLVWDIIYPRTLPQREGLGITEVGSAPGTRLVRFKKEFGYEPYGIEYSDSGVELNRRVFAENGIDPDNVIHADFFSQDFADKYRGFFDIVCSWSFVEHFENSKDAINRHVDLLKDDGIALIVIPNLRWLNYLIAMSLMPGWKEIHNFGIMDKRKLMTLAEQAGLVTLHCDYLGAFTFRIFQTRPGSPLRFLLRLGFAVQPILNVLLRSIFGRKSPECRYLSPYLIYIGRKQNTLKSTLHT